MNILFICDEYPPGKNGGIGTVVQVLGRELVKQGHKVCVAGLYRYRYEELDYEEDQGVKVWRMRFGLNLRLKPASRVYNVLEKMPPLIRRNLNGKKAFHTYIQFLHRLIEQEKIAVIEIPDWNNFAFFIGFVVSWPAFKVPLIVKSHGSYTYFNTELGLPLNTLLHTIDVALFRRANAISAVSQYTANENKKLFSLDKPVKVLYNSIQVSPQNNLPRRKQTVIFTGTLIQKKGIFQLLKAWNLVHARLPDAELLIFGKGKTTIGAEYLNSAAASTVVFKGHVPRAVLFDELRSATLAVFPSYTETFGLMCVEAMSVGCPVIYTRRSCGPEIVQDEKNGLLVDPDNLEEIANAIVLLLEGELLRKKYADEATKTVLERFNIVNSAREHVAYYQEVINDFTRRGNSL